MSENEPRERKSLRKQHVGNKKKSNYDITEEQKFVSKSKKAFKNKKQNLHEEELWEDWEDYQ